MPATEQPPPGATEEPRSGRRIVGIVFSSVTLLLLIFVAAGLIGWRLYPDSETSTGSPAHLSVSIAHSVGVLEHVTVSVHPVRSDHLVVAVDAVADVGSSADPARKDDATLTLYERTVVTASTSAYPSHQSSTVPASLSGTKDAFHWTIDATGGSIGVQDVNDAVFFGLPDVRDTGPRPEGAQTVVDRYLIGQPDWSALAWTQTPPNRVNPKTGTIGWEADTLTPTGFVQSALAQGTDLVLIRQDQARLFLSGAFIAISGGALVALAPEIAHARERRAVRAARQ